MTAPQPGQPRDWGQFYRDHPQPDLAEVNTMTLPEALVWYHRNWYDVRPVEITPDGGRRLALLHGYHFDDLPRPSEEEIAWLAANFNPAWQLGMILSKSSGMWGIDADDMAQWARFKAAHKDHLNLTATQQTGRDGGGLSLVYGRPEEGRIDGDVLRPGKWSWEYPGIEVKSKGFITVAPSVHHKTGRLYQWLADHPGSPREPSRGLLASRGHVLLEDRIDLRRAELHIEREARRREDAAELAQVTGARKILSYDALLAEPQPRMIIQGLLTAGLYGLAGPPEAGKSLWCRDLACGLAADGQSVLYALSEGQFDLRYRFGSHPSIEDARERLSFLDVAMSLASPADVDWLITQARGVSMIIFDMIYGFGLPDDEGTKGVAPVLAGCKRLATELGCAVLITGHPGHNTGRRFRGSSMWRGSFDGEFHMAENRMSCEKHKYADKRKIGWDYTVAYPHLRLLNVIDQLGAYARRAELLAEDLRRNPHETDAARARRLATQMGLTEDHLRRLIRQAKKGQEQ